MLNLIQHDNFAFIVFISNYFILKERGCEKFFKIPNPLEDFYLDDIINFEHSEKS